MSFTQLAQQLRSNIINVSNETIFSINSNHLSDLINLSRDRVNQWLTNYKENVETIRMLGKQIDIDGNEIILDKKEKFSIKISSPNALQIIATVYHPTTLINVQGGELIDELFNVTEHQLSSNGYHTIKPGQGFKLASQEIAYRINSTAPVLVAKLQESPNSVYAHYFSANGHYECSIPTDYNVYHAYYALCIAVSLGKLNEILQLYLTILIKGPTPFLWETTKLLIEEKSSVCYTLLDEIIKRNDPLFSNSAQLTKNNIKGVV